MQSRRFVILLILLLGLVMLPNSTAHTQAVTPPSMPPVPWQANVDAHGTIDGGGNFHEAIVTWKALVGFPTRAYQVIPYRLAVDTIGQSHWLVDHSPAIKVHYTGLTYATVAGLSLGTTYHFTIRTVGPTATSGSIESLPSKSFVPSRSVPGDPINVSALAANGSATLMWYPRLGADIDHYLVQVYTMQAYNTGGDPVQYVDAVANPPLQITGLANGTTYVLTVRLVDSHGMLSVGASTQVTPKAPAPVLILSANRTAIEPGDQVVLTGKGFTPGTQISIAMGGGNTGASGNYGTTVTDSTGSFSLAVTPTRYPDGSLLHAGSIVLVAHSPAWDQSASVQLRVVTLSASPTAMHPGDTVVLTGDGFTPGAWLTISLGTINAGAAGSYGSVVADINGHFRVAVSPTRYPDGSLLHSGSIVLVAHTASWDQKASAWVQVLATPLLSADRTTIKPGDHVLLTGQWFTPGAWLTISMGSPNTGIGGSYGTVVADAYGRFSIDVVLDRYPNGSPLQAGPIALFAHTFDGGEQASVQLWVVRTPDQPANVSARAGNAQAVVSWTPPYNGGSLITSYRVTAYLGGTASVASVTTVPGSSTSATVTGLVNGFTYTFTVQAVNANGAGPESARSNLIMLATVPSAVRNLTVTGGDESAVVRWDVPASDGSSAISGYQVTASDGIHTPIVVFVSTTGATLTGLTNATTYTITVAAINAVGQGPAAAAMVVPRNLPPALSVPGTLTVHHGDVVAATVTASDVEARDHLTLAASGLPAGVIFTDQGNGTGTLGGNAEVPAGTYNVTFTVNDGHNPPVAQSMALTVTREQAEVRLFPTAPLSVVLKSATQMQTKSLTIRATIREVTDPNGYADIAEAANVTYTLTSVHTGASYSGMASTTGQGVEGTLTTKYTFRNIPRGIYELRISVGGNYYQGTAEAMVAVSSSAMRGGVTGNGQVNVPGSNASAHFQFKAQRLANGKLSGSFLYVEQGAGGTYTFKSTSITALVFKGQTAYIQGTGTLNGVGRQQFVATIVDNHQLGRADRLGLRVIDTTFATVGHCTFAPVDLTSGQARIVHG